MVYSHLISGRIHRLAVTYSPVVVKTHAFHNLHFACLPFRRDEIGRKHTGAVTSSENQIAAGITRHRTIIEIRKHEIRLKITIFSALPYPHVQSGIRREPDVALAVFRDGAKILDIFDSAMTDTSYRYFFLRGIFHHT
ncbi:hypothetical protein IMSAGC016_01240 [Muribaculaceae bacterium]|nr:hypothetical protein IMSAGC016_01240 [Muribaculaceae bacterium]